MVMFEEFDEMQRQIAAKKIEARLVQFAQKLHMSIDRFEWNLGQGLGHCGPHRLTLTLGRQTVKIYFTDIELADYWGAMCSTVGDQRLFALLSKFYVLTELQTNAERLMARNARTSGTPSRCLPKKRVIGRKH